MFNIHSQLKLKDTAFGLALVASFIKIHKYKPVYGINLNYFIYKYLYL